MLAERANPHGIKAAHRRRGKIASRVWLPGQYFDTETGLHYNYFRDYEPGTGRYVESDPIGLSAGVETYQYAHSNTIRRIDPFGLADEACCRSREAVDYFQNANNGKGAGGTVMCCGGQKVACTAPSMDSPSELMQIVKNCAKKHEERHIPDVSKCNCGRPPYPAPGPDIPIRESECAASRIEIECLSSGADNCKTAECQQEIALRIRGLVSFGNGNKPGCLSPF
ncbi:MAG: hypothetical protein NVSMB6_14170 [Burkholderiaceae bacterium]